jgi:hypothetical protein
MKRLRLFELHDQSWFPEVLRELLTDGMSFFAVSLRPYKPVVPLLLPLIAGMEEKRIVDLCSGAGGPARWLLEECSKAPARPSEVRVVLSDKYPNCDAYRELQRRFGEAVSFVDHSLDAADVPTELSGFRTLFTSFHHFRPEEAREVLADAVRKRQPIGVFEYTERNFLVWGLPLLLTPAFLWLITPLIRPFRWKRLLWTYLLPVVPLVGVWDGFVSCLRTYTPEELLELSLAATPAGDYKWRAGKLQSFGACRITYLIGMPHRSVS